MSYIRNTATWGNINLADERASKGHFATKEAYEAYLELLEAWDEALEEDKDRNPDICDWSDTANVGYGSDEIMKCGAKATHIVSFESYDQESDTWDNITLNVCGFHGHAIRDDTDKADNIRNVYVQDKVS